MIDLKKSVFFWGIFPLTWRFYANLLFPCGSDCFAFFMWDLSLESAAAGLGWQQRASLCCEALHAPCGVGYVAPLVSGMVAASFRGQQGWCTLPIAIQSLCTLYMIINYKYIIYIILILMWCVLMCIVYNFSNICILLYVLTVCTD